MPVRPVPLAAVVLAALLVLPAVASAQIANFSASITGTYTAQGSMSDSSCFTETTDGDVTHFTQTGTANEQDTFRSTKPLALQVSRVPRQRTFDAGSFSHLQTAFTLTRTSTVDPASCRGDDADQLPPPDCGTKHGTYPLRVYGRVDRAAFSFLFTRGSSTFHPDDPFQSCPLFGPGWPGALETSGPAPASARRLFDRHVRTIVVHGREHGTVKPDPGGTRVEGGTYDLRWTLTLKRRR